MVHFLKQRRIILIHHIDLIAGGAGERRLIRHAEHAGLLALVVIPFYQVGHHHIGRFLPQRLQIIDIVLHADDLRMLDMLINETLVGTAGVHNHLHIRLVDFFKAAERWRGAAVRQGDFAIGHHRMAQGEIFCPCRRLRYASHSDIKLIGF